MQNRCAQVGRLLVVEMKCTYCETKLVFRNGNKKTKRAGMDILRLVCPNCGELFLASDGPYSHPYQTHPHRLPNNKVKKVHSIRLSETEKIDVENGKAILTFNSNRLQLQYIQ